jgi:hypothetical protein
MSGRVLRFAAIAVLTLAVGAGCGKKSPGAASAPDPSSPPVAATTPASAAPIPDGSPEPVGTGWPSPEDCITYNPTTVTATFANGTYTVTDGTQTVMILHGSPGDTLGAKAVALAQRYDEHCFIGRGNTRGDAAQFVFDYWRNPSGLNPPIPDQDKDCSDYNRANLTVEDMGNGEGWRVKDHDHVLHVFDNQADARNGQLVLSQFSQLCFLGNSDEEDQDTISYLL